MDYDPSNEDHLEIMQYLMAEGAAMFDGYDDEGEPIYKFDMEILEEVMPELHQAMKDDLDQILLDLFQEGLLDVVYDENLNAQFDISEAGKIALMQSGFDIDDIDAESF